MHQKLAQAFTLAPPQKNHLVPPEAGLSPPEKNLVTTMGGTVNHPWSWFTGTARGGLDTPFKSSDVCWNFYKRYEF